MPPAAAFARLGVRVLRELPGGYQSRVLLAERQDAAAGTRPVAVKLIQAPAGPERDLALARLRVRDAVAGYDDRVAPIVALGDAKVNGVGDLLVVGSPFIEGRPFDLTNRADVERMGRALARLHQSLRLVHVELPPVAALRVGAPVEGLHEDHQLLHGDFAPSNLLLDGDGRVWILDFDECGTGPVEFELGNTLFMALFDSSPSLNQPSEQYRQFRHWFIGAYKASAEHAVSDLLVDLGLQARSDALRHWLTHLETAPPGIRNASEAWHRHLRAFAGIMQR